MAKILRRYSEIDSLDASTKAVVRYLVAEQMRKGTSPYELQATLHKELGIEREAAWTIARTELARENGILNMEGMRQAEKGGLQLMKGWSTANDEQVCEVCRRNRQVGYIPLEEAFPSGHLHPPAHPRCRCVVVPHRVVK